MDSNKDCEGGELQDEGPDPGRASEDALLQNGSLSLQRAGYLPYEPSYLAKPSVMQTTLVQQPDDIHRTYLAASGQFVFSDSPVSMRCPYCRKDITTALLHQPGSMTWLAIGTLVALCCWLGCCLVPLYVDALKDVVHTCPNCRRRLGISRRIQSH